MQRNRVVKEQANLLESIPLELLHLIISRLDDLHDVRRFKCSRRLSQVSRAVLCGERWRVARSVAASSCDDHSSDAWQERLGLFSDSPEQFVAGLEFWSAEALNSRAVVIVQRLLRHIPCHEWRLGDPAGTVALSGMEFLLSHLRRWDDMAKARSLLPAGINYHRRVGVADVVKGLQDWDVDKAAALLCCCAALEHRGGGDWRGKAALVLTTVALDEWPTHLMGKAGLVAARLIGGSHDAAHAWRVLLGRLEPYAPRHRVADFLRAALPLRAVLPMLISHGIPHGSPLVGCWRDARSAGELLGAWCSRQPEDSQEVLEYYKPAAIGERARAPDAQRVCTLLRAFSPHCAMQAT